MTTWQGKETRQPWQMSKEPVVLIRTRHLAALSINGPTVCTPAYLGTKPTGCRRTPGGCRRRRRRKFDIGPAFLSGEIDGKDRMLCCACFSVKTGSKFFPLSNCQIWFYKLSICLPPRPLIILSFMVMSSRPRFYFAMPLQRNL